MSYFPCITKTNISSVETNLKTYIHFSGTETLLKHLFSREMGTRVSEDERKPLSCNKIHIHLTLLTTFIASVYGKQVWSFGDGLA